MRFTYFLCC
uniref:Uncharacterized protein n=1 Tax=Rhizophora mucronata TaxID=61149 RepID=A0A2P2P113_RHIMU